MSPLQPAGAASLTVSSLRPSIFAACSGFSFASGGSIRPPQRVNPSVMTGRRASHAGWCGDGYVDIASSTAWRRDGLSSAFAIAHPAHASARSSLSHESFIHAAFVPVASR